MATLRGVSSEAIGRCALSTSGPHLLPCLALSCQKVVSTAQVSRAFVWVRLFVYSPLYIHPNGTPRTLAFAMSYAGSVYWIKMIWSYNYVCTANDICEEFESSKHSVKFALPCCPASLLLRQTNRVEATWS